MVGKGRGGHFYLEKCANLRAVGGRIASTGGDPLRNGSYMDMGLGAYVTSTPRQKDRTEPTKPRPHDSFTANFILFLFSIEVLLLLFILHISLYQFFLISQPKIINFRKFVHNN